DANAAVVVAGDLNDFEFSSSVQALTGVDMVDLITTLPANERYTYVFQGNSQVLDHLLVSPGLAGGASVDVVHVNSEFADQASDQAPQVAPPPVASGGPPTTAHAAAIGTDRVVVTWDPVAGATGYKVLGSSISGGPYPQLLTTPASASSAMVTG